jgi:peptide/nickel transport system substrate-binding protein
MSKMIRCALIAAAAPLALSLAMTAPGAAQELRIGLSAEPSALDPHYHQLGPNNQVATQVYERLTDQDENQKPGPSLAESYRAINEKTWEFKLRKGVKFSDGSDFTARDVIYSYCRVPKVENSPSSFITSTRMVDTMTAPDPHTIVITTAEPFPLMAITVSNVAIISSKNGGAPDDLKYNKAGCEGVAAWPKTDDFNKMKYAGTGPFKYTQFTPGDRIVMEANENYWGQKPKWKKVILRPITNAASRVAALLANDVDFIENPPIQDLPRIKANTSLALTSKLSNRIIYLHFNYLADVPPGLSEAGEKNPFRDKRVREAISLAIDREAIVARIMSGEAKAAAEFLPNPLAGTNPGIQAAKPDPVKAKKLLAEAGYPNGFGLTIGTPNDRYINDAQVTQAVAQMLTRIGIKAQVDAMTAATFFSRRTKREFGIWLAGWGADTGEMSNPLRALVATPDTKIGFGATNPGGYSNKEMDDLLKKAMTTVDDTQRNTMLAQASRIVMADFGAIPLHFEVTTWAFKKGLNYIGQTNQYTRPDRISQK